MLVTVDARAAPPSAPSSASSRSSPPLYRAFDSWAGLGLIAIGMARQGFRLSLSHIAEGEWRCAWMGDNPMLAPAGYGVATTPWAAVQVAGWAVVRVAARRLVHPKGLLRPGRVSVYTDRGHDVLVRLARSGPFRCHCRAQFKSLHGSNQ